MVFNVKPFVEILAMTKEKIDEALAPIRAKTAKAKADLEMAKLEEKLVSQENKIHKLCAESELNFNQIADAIDEYELANRRKKQIEKIINDLFPKAGA